MKRTQEACLAQRHDMPRICSLTRDHVGPHSWEDELERSRSLMRDQLAESYDDRTRMAGEAEQLRKERDYLVSEYERAVKCGPLGYAHAASHIYNAVVNAKCDVNADRFIELMDQLKVAEGEAANERKHVESLRKQLEESYADRSLLLREAEELHKQLEEATGELFDLRKQLEATETERDDLFNLLAEANDRAEKAEAKLATAVGGSAWFATIREECNADRTRLAGEAEDLRKQLEEAHSAADVIQETADMYLARLERAEKAEASGDAKLRQLLAWARKQSPWGDQDERILIRNVLDGVCDEIDSLLSDPAEERDDGPLREVAHGSLGPSDYPLRCLEALKELCRRELARGGK